MPNVVTKFQNEGRWEIESQVDLSSAGAVGAVRGTNCVWTKTGTGTYTCVVKGNSGQKLFAVLSAKANLVGASPATVFTARITGVTQATDGSDDVTISVSTLTNAATPAAADTTAAITLDVHVIIQSARMGNPFAP